MDDDSDFTEKEREEIIEDINDRLEELQSESVEQDQDFNDKESESVCYYCEDIAQERRRSQIVAHFTMKNANKSI